MIPSEDAFLCLFPSLKEKLLISPVFRRENKTAPPKNKVPPKKN